MSLLQMSISAGAMILVFTMIRTLAIHRLPKKCFLLLWALVVCRLLIPFSWPSPLSMHVLLSEASAVQQRGIIALNAAIPVEAAHFDGPVSAASISLGVWIWFFGVTVCALYFILAYFQCRRWFLQARLIENDVTQKFLASHKHWRPVRICALHGLNAPLTCGFLRPVILMPVQTDWSNTKQVQYILTHEFVHIRRCDGIFKLLLIAALCLHWFNPLVWLMYIQANRDIELSCDEKVIQLCGEAIKFSYAQMLLYMEEQKSRQIPLCSNFNKHAVEERIVAIMNRKKYTMVTILVTILLAGGATAVFATSAAAPVSIAVTQDTSLDPPAPKAPGQQELLRDYGPYGISFDVDGNMLYHDELVRYFCDGAELDAGAWAIAYEYLNERGTVDVFTKRTVIDNGDGSIDPFGLLVDLVPSSQQEFDQRDISPAQLTAATVYEGDNSGDPGETLAAMFAKYEAYGITYEEERPGSGAGNVFYHKQPVKRFIDAAPDGSIFTYDSRDGGEITVHTLYDAQGKFLGIEEGAPKGTQ